MLNFWVNNWNKIRTNQKINPFILTKNICTQGYYSLVFTCKSIIRYQAESILKQILVDFLNSKGKYFNKIHRNQVKFYKNISHLPEFRDIFIEAEEYCLRHSENDRKSNYSSQK